MSDSALNRFRTYKEEQMTKANCVRPGIMSLIRVKENGNIVKEAWLDLIHNKGYVEVDVTKSPEPEPEPEPEPIWLDISGGFSGTTDEEDTHVFLTKTVDGYDISATIGGGTPEDFVATATVTKDGKSAGTTSIWFVFKDFDEVEIGRCCLSDMLCEMTSEYHFDFHFQSDPRTFKGFLGNCSLETDAETELCDFNVYSLTHNGVELDEVYAETYVKLEPAE